MTGVPQHRKKFLERKKTFSKAVDSANGNPLDVLEPYRNERYFRDQGRLLIDVARDQMLQAVRRHFKLPEDSITGVVKRIKTKDLAGVSQGHYVAHVSHSFNLENRITKADLRLFLRCLTPVTGHVFRTYPSHKYFSTENLKM